MRRDDRIRLQHMRDAAREAVAFTQGRTRADLDRDRMLVLALVKEIEIVGEAAFARNPGPGYGLPQLDLIEQREHNMCKVLRDL